jgi:hypothetical protein
MTTEIVVLVSSSTPSGLGVCLWYLSGKCAQIFCFRCGGADAFLSLCILFKFVRDESAFIELGWIDLSWSFI